MEFLHRLAGVTLVNIRPIPFDDILSPGCPWSISDENYVESTGLRKVLPISLSISVSSSEWTRLWTRCAVELLSS